MRGASTTRRVTFGDSWSVATMGCMDVRGYESTKVGRDLMLPAPRPRPMRQAARSARAEGHRGGGRRTVPRGQEAAIQGKIVLIPNH